MHLFVSQQLLLFRTCKPSMADPLSIITTATSVILALVDTLEVVSALSPSLLKFHLLCHCDHQSSENKKEISKLMTDVQTDIDDLTQLRKCRIGDREELDRPFHGLIACVVNHCHLDPKND